VDNQQIVVLIFGQLEPKVHQDHNIKIQLTTNQLAGPNYAQLEPEIHPRLETTNFKIFDGFEQGIRQLKE